MLFDGKSLFLEDRTIRDLRLDRGAEECHVDGAEVEAHAHVKEINIEIKGLLQTPQDQPLCCVLCCDLLCARLALEHSKQPRAVVHNQLGNCTQTNGLTQTYVEVLQGLSLLHRLETQVEAGQLRHRLHLHLRQASAAGGMRQAAAGKRVPGADGVLHTHSAERFVSARCVANHRAVQRHPERLAFCERTAGAVQAQKARVAGVPSVDPNPCSGARQLEASGGTTPTEAEETLSKAKKRLRLEHIVTLPSPQPAKTTSHG